MKSTQNIVGWYFVPTVCIAFLYNGRDTSRGIHKVASRNGKYWISMITCQQINWSRIWIIKATHQTCFKLVDKKKSTGWCVFTNAFGNSFFINTFCLWYSCCHLRFAFFCAVSQLTQRTLQTELKIDVIIKILLRLKHDLILIFTHIPLNQGKIKYCAFNHRFSADCVVCDVETYSASNSQLMDRTGSD